jgi:threonine dehydrogenase-like Zn-dependent dehydrogenase
LPATLNPVVGCFVRVGAIALNAVLAAAAGIGDTVVIFGQGVIGLIATFFARLGGALVIAVDGIEQRRAKALQLGAQYALAPGPGTAQTIRRLTGGRGADVAIEISGSYAALREAIRSVGADSTVIAAGFYQGPGTSLLLGQEFHHNRVSVVASQIGSLPARLYPRWDRDRLQRTVLDLLTSGRPVVGELVSHRFDLADAGSAFRLLDENPEAALQVLLEFP